MPHKGPGRCKQRKALLCNKLDIAARRRGTKGRSFLKGDRGLAPLPACTVERALISPLLLEGEQRMRVLIEMRKQMYKDGSRFLRFTQLHIMASSMEQSLRRGDGMAETVNQALAIPGRLT